jgi:uncharacterized membrane protein YphA (DoxX/SURF4 family)
VRFFSRYSRQTHVPKLLLRERPTLASEPRSVSVLPPDTALALWSPFARGVLRFVYAYIFLYAIYSFTNVASFLLAPVLKGRSVFFIDAALQSFVPWFGIHILRIHEPITYSPSGDASFSWIEHLLFLLVALLTALLWSLVDSRRPHYRTLDQWLRLIVRFALASLMFAYGFDKVFPLQFHSISRPLLVQQFGTLDHFRLMWSFMAASKGYTIFSGLLEVLSGVLLLIPALTNVGAIACAVVMSNVVALNFAYNIPVKLFSSNILLMALFLIAPVLPRLMKLLVLNQTVPPQVTVSLSANRKVDRTARTLQVVFGFLIAVLFCVEQGAHYAAVRAAEAATTPWQGIWQVDELNAPTGPQHPLFTPKLSTEMHLGPGDDRWSRLIFDRPNELVIQTLSGQMDYVDLALNGNATHADITDSGDSTWKATLDLDQPSPDHLHIHGLVNGVPLDATLHRLDESRFEIKDESLHLVNR